MIKSSKPKIYSLFKFTQDPNRTDDNPTDKKSIRIQYSQKILKYVVGEEKAMQTLATISMGFIPGMYMSNLSIKRNLTPKWLL